MRLLLFLLLTLPAVAQNTARIHFEEMQKLIVEVSNRVKSSVVHVEVIARRGEERRKAMGSGLILTSDGVIVTNHHVIDHAERVTVILDDKTKYDATITRKDKQTDLALLKIKPEKSLHAARLADSEQVQVGQWVIAIGNPFGFDRTVSFGIVSGKGRYLPDSENEERFLNDFIQTDALIDPGSSGGPLMNLQGEVLGINSVGIGRGQGFTIPSRVVQELTTRPEVEGQLERGWLGLFPQALTRELATYWGAPGLKGILISDVVQGSPAAKAGLQSGDVLTGIDGEAVEAEQEVEIQGFKQRVTRFRPGARLALNVKRRNGADWKEQKLTLEVGQQPPVEPAELESDFGATFSELNLARSLQYRLDQSEGIVVTHVTPSGAAQDAEVEVGDVVLEIDGRPVTQLEEMRQRLKETRSRVLLKLRKGKLIHYALVEKRRR